MSSPGKPPGNRGGPWVPAPYKPSSAIQPKIASGPRVPAAPSKALQPKVGGAGRMPAVPAPINKQHGALQPKMASGPRMPAVPPPVSGPGRSGAALQPKAAARALLTPGGIHGVIQRLVKTAYQHDDQGRPVLASATVTYDDLGTGTAANVNANLVYGHHGNAHPYHHERGHLIGKQLGGDGSDARNLVGLSDGTNAPLMTDIENFARKTLTKKGESFYIITSVDWSNTHYNGPAAAPYVKGTTVGAIGVAIYDKAGGKELFSRLYPNGVVRNHKAAGCC